MQSAHSERRLLPRLLPEGLWAKLSGLAILVLVSVAAGALIVWNPMTVLAIALAGVAVGICLRVGSIPMIALAAIAGLVPLHVLVLRIGVPGWWKEALIAGTLLLALPRLRASLHGGLPVLIALFAITAVASGLLNGRLGAYDLGPYIAYAPLAFSVPALIRGPVDVRRLAFVAACATAINALVVIAARIQNTNLVQDTPVPSDFLGEIRPASFVGSNLLTATLLGIAAAAGIAWFLLGPPEKLRSRLWQVAFPALFVVAAAMTLARSALVPSIAALVTLPILLGRAGRRLRAMSFVALAAAATAAIIFALTASSDPVIVQRIASVSANASADATRVDRWRSTIELAVEKPLLGHGPGYTGFSRVREVLGPNPAYTPDDIDVPISESSWLKIAAETGLVGALLALAVALRAARSLLDAARKNIFALVMLVTLISIVAQGMIYPNMETAVASICFWSIVGLSQSFGSQEGFTDSRTATEAVQKPVDPRQSRRI